MEFGSPTESEIFSTAGSTLNKAFIDIYFRGIALKVPPKIHPVAGTVWSIFWTFCTAIWPHDGGHWVRAKQVGGNFVITKFGFPFPTAEMYLPDQISLKDETLTCIGGQEINEYNFP